jgi:plastocyanin
VRNDFFNPEVITINAGGTVTWTWVGQNHNVTSVLSPTFASNSPTRDAPFTHGPLTFTTPGTYHYICTVHGAVVGGETTGMRGRVVVLP